jgi:DNA helicase-2/ATP-dependent DNA helicase PcrA
LKRQNALDFDDLLLLAVQVLGSTQVLARYQRRLRYLLVDEYQDTNHVQYRLINLLAGRAATSAWWATWIRASTPGGGLPHPAAVPQDYPDARMVTLVETIAPRPHPEAANAARSRTTPSATPRTWTSNPGAKR